MGQEIPGILDDIERGDITPAPCPFEADYHTLWRCYQRPGVSPSGVALIGGAISDRLGWVFLGGYQGAMQYCFDAVERSTWSAFVASEDRAHYPATTLAERDTHVELNGVKSWVAGSRSVAELVVLVGGRVFLVPAADAEISHRRRASFLGDVSQGRCEFKSTKVLHTQELQAPRARMFGPAEPVFIFQALLGQMLAHAVAVPALNAAYWRARVSPVALELARIADCELGDEAGAVAAANEAYRQIARDFADAIEAARHPLARDWHVDGLLIGMYSRGIRARAAAD